MARPRHPDKEIEAAVAYAEARGWTFREMGHRRRLFCTYADRDGCQIGVNGTPRNAGAHARQIGARSIDAHMGATAMRTFEFTIVASGLDPTAPDFESRFYDAGCDDATVSFQRGRILLDFAREAETVASALASAANAVLSAGATIDRIEPDPLVNLSDIAARAGVSRAAVTQYAKGQRGRDFPPPVARVTADGPLWDWAGVARWLFLHERLPREAVVEAEAVRQANAALASGRQQFGDDLRIRVDEIERSL